MSAAASAGSAVELLQALIHIPSVNPAGKPGIAAVGEERCAEAAGDFLQMLGAEVELREVLPGRPNVVGRFKNRTAGRPRILFAPHTDTVSVAGMTIDPFGGEVRDGRIWGRGASDTKGSIASMLWAFREVGEAIRDCSYEVWFAGLAGEEAGQHGAKALAASDRFDFVIAGEPTGLQVVNTHKGCTNLHLTTRGVAVHAASPQDGENAINKMAQVLIAIETEIAPNLRRHVHPALGSPTISVGTIAGGSKSNIVPDQCQAVVDLRTIPMMEGVELTSSISERLWAHCPSLEISAQHALALATDAQHPLIQKMERLGARCVGAPWFCDAAVFAREGMAAVAVGPGSIAQAHTCDEWIGVKELEEGVDFFARFLRSL